MGNTIYILDNGHLEMDKNMLVALAAMGTLDNKNQKVEWIQAPVFCVLIDNPELGWILFDTGCHPDSMKGRLPPFFMQMLPYFHTDEQLLVNQLGKLGLKPEDIKTVVLSHMHYDHSSGLFQFMDTAEVYVNRDEYMNYLFSVYAAPDPGDTCKSDVTEAARKYHFLENRDYELAPGVELIYLPGHSVGMMGLLVHLDSGVFIFPVDVLNLAENYGPPARLSSTVFDSKAMKESIEKVRGLERKYNAKLIFPHDMMQFKTLKLAPDCYK